MSNTDLDTSAYDDVDPEELKRRLAYLEKKGSSAGDTPFDAHRPVRREAAVFNTRREERDDYQRRFNASTRGSRVKTSPSDSLALVDVREGEQWVRELGGARLAAHLARNSSSPGMRKALSEVNPESW